MSVETQGPEMPKVYAMRPTRKLKPCPVIAAEFESATPCDRQGPYSYTLSTVGENEDTKYRPEGVCYAAHSEAQAVARDCSQV